MKRCTAAAISTRLPVSRGWQSRRWASHDRASLSKETVLENIEAGLGRDAHGNPIHIDVESKTVSTDAGDLPISPVFDPAWIKSRRRERKNDPGKPTGRLRRKLTLNPYARALATPLRVCSVTGVALPRYFLQDFELVSHPETGKPWFAPGPLAFDRVKPRKYSDGSPKEAQLGEGGHGKPSAIEEGSGTAATEPAKMAQPDDATGSKGRPRRAPVTIYTLNRKDLLDIFKNQSKSLGVLTSTRTGMAWSSAVRKAVWRTDMGDTILHMMRSLAVDTLISRANREHGLRTRFIEPVPSWEAIRDVLSRQSVLWLPRGGDGDVAAQTSAPGQAYATFDVDNVKYNGKMAVHNLPWLLGSEGVARLKQGAPDIFGENELLVLKYWGSQSMVNLHMLLWRLHGYLQPVRRKEPPERG